MATVTEEQVDPTAVVAPDPGFTRHFTDLAGVARAKQDDNSVTPVSPNVATSIEPSSPGTVIPITGGVGAVGDLLTKTVDGGSPEVALVNPRVSGASKSTQQLRAVVVAGANTADLVLGELLVVDLEAIAGNHEVFLPPAAGADVGQSISVKVFGPAAGNTLLLTPAGPDVIDKAQASRSLTFNREFITLRIRLGGGGWLEGDE